MNPTLQSLHDSLLAQHDALAQKLDDCTNAADAQAILTQMQEITHRVDSVQNLLLKATADSLTTALVAVGQADAKLTATLQGVASAAAIVAGVTQFLGVVDEAIAVAKLIL
jgi:hypothetical protein